MWQVRVENGHPLKHRKRDFIRKWGPWDLKWGKCDLKPSPAHVSLNNQVYECVFFVQLNTIQERNLLDYNFDKN